jgi:hypothetical protein
MALHADVWQARKQRFSSQSTYPEARPSVDLSEYTTARVVAVLAANSQFRKEDRGTVPSRYRLRAPGVAHDAVFVNRSVESLSGLFISR